MLGKRLVVGTHDAVGSAQHDFRLPTFAEWPGLKRLWEFLVVGPRSACRFVEQICCAEWEAAGGWAVMILRNAEKKEYLSDSARALSSGPKSLVASFLRPLATADGLRGLRGVAPAAAAAVAAEAAAACRR